MRTLKLLLVLVCGALICGPAAAATAKIIKVLPHFTDREGRIALSPSLYERDAYQAVLRSKLEQRSGLRFDVQWKASTRSPLALRVEMRGIREQKPTTAMIEAPVQHRGLFRKWAIVALSGADYRAFGEMRAWRATLWDGQNLVAEQKSFLW
jgi:hypothetical protein